MTASNAPILIVEDEPDLATLLSDYLSAAGYTSALISDGAAVENWLSNHTCQLILLDLMLPNKSGFDICKAIRKNSDTPIIMMTAKIEEIDRLLGLELGADDYICKPYSPREVVARVKAVLKRVTPAASDANTSVNDTHARLTLKPDSNIVLVDSQPIELTVVEYKILALLYSQPGRIFSRQYILDNIYNDYRIVSDRTVDSHIKKLRKKLNSTSLQSDVIRSVYGAGYKYDA